MRAVNIHITPLEQHVIDFVKKMRIEQGYTQEELAMKMNLDSSFIGHVESPRRAHKYNLRHIQLLAEIFQCSPASFLPDNNEYLGKKFKKKST